MVEDYIDFACVTSFVLPYRYKFFIRTYSFFSILSIALTVIIGLTSCSEKDDFFTGNGESHTYDFHGKVEKVLLPALLSA